MSDAADSLVRVVERLGGIPFSAAVDTLRQSLAGAGLVVDARGPHRTDLRFSDMPCVGCALYPSTQRLECTVKVQMSPHELPEEDWQRVHDDFVATWDRARGRLSSTLGPAQFSGGPLDAGFPGDEDAIRLALWTRGGTRLGLQYRHEDKELPMRLVLVMTPASPD